MKEFITVFAISFLFIFKVEAQTGIPVQQMSDCDILIEGFMSTYEIPGASFALSKNGKLIYQRAFGNINRNENEQTQPHHLFRIASLSKPITSIAIMNMVENNKISLTDQVFGDGGLLDDHSIISKVVIRDSRIYDITVQNLLEHTAGWNRSVDCFPDPTFPYPYNFSGCDPIVAPLHVTTLNGTTNPAKEEDMIVFLLEKGLDFTPNTDYAYSNIGYLILGEIIEEISGESYEEYLQNNIFSPIGICDMHIGKNLLQDKLEREVEYIGNGFTTLSCYGTGVSVPWEYGGFNVEAMDAHGGWVATAEDLVRLLVAIDGFPSKADILSKSSLTTMTTASTNNSRYAKGWSVNNSNNWWHTGALDGTATFFARTNGQYTWALLLNKRARGANANLFWRDLDRLPWSCISTASSFPSHDLLDKPMSNSDNITFPVLSKDSMTIRWTSGDGSRRIVVAKENGSISDFPLDGESYIANAKFEAGDNLGNKSFVVYDGIGNTVNVTNLKPNTSYSFRVFDYNESPNTGNYKLYKLCGNNEAQMSTIITGTSDISNNHRINLYPTVTNDFLNIEFLENEKMDRYSIYSTTGVLAQEGELKCKTCQINISNLKHGFYLIDIQTKKRDHLRKKFTKK